MSIINKGVFDADTMFIRQTGNDWPAAQVTTTADVVESSVNLYFTNARVVSALVSGTSITIEANGRISSAGGITPNSNVEGNLRITGTLTANAFASSGFGVPTLTSATNINLSANAANGGAVVIQNSPLRLRSYTTVDRGNITASTGDLIYNSTVNTPQAFTGTKWGNVFIDGYWPARPAFRVVGSGGPLVTPNTLTSSNWTVDYNQGGYLSNTTGYFTAPIAGLYSINAVVRTFTNSSPGITQIIVYKNNTIALIMIEFGSNTTMNHAGGSTIAYLAAGDNIKLAATQGTISFDGNDNFSAAYIG